jgi:hypothetical protein
VLSDVQPIVKKESYYLMKIAISVLTALLFLTLTAGALFYLKAYKPMEEDNARMTTRMPELDKAAIELRQRKEKESKETAWLKPAIETLSAGLGNEIKSGEAEVLAAGNKVVVNISEHALYLPGSYTFSKESPQLRSNLVALLKSDTVKGKDIYIGNTTHAVPAQGRGRKKIAAKDARTLAAERSAALIKDMEKNGVNHDALIAAAYSPQQPRMGLIKDRKTVIIIESPPTVPLGATNVAAARTPFPDSRGTLTVPAPRPASQTQPGAIPIQPARPPKAQ